MDKKYLSSYGHSPSLTKRDIKQTLMEIDPSDEVITHMLCEILVQFFCGF